MLERSPGWYPAPKWFVLRWARGMPPLAVQAWREAGAEEPQLTLEAATVELNAAVAEEPSPLTTEVEAEPQAFRRSTEEAERLRVKEHPTSSAEAAWASPIHQEEAEADPNQDAQTWAEEAAAWKAEEGAQNRFVQQAQLASRRPEREEVKREE